MQNYVGDAIAIKFEVFMDGKPARILQSVVEVYDPKDTLVIREQTKITNRKEISYSLDGGKVTDRGEYKFFFELLIDNYGDITKVIKRKVKPREV
jgi:hypothetical protein